jgi:hypothetical protein
MFTSWPAPTLLQTVLFAGMESVRDAGRGALPGTGVAFKTPVISRSVVFRKAAGIFWGVDFLRAIGRRNLEIAKAVATVETVAV